jgi:hypothetical protein
MFETCEEYDISNEVSYVVLKSEKGKTILRIKDSKVTVFSDCGSVAFCDTSMIDGEKVGEIYLH